MTFRESFFQVKQLLVSKLQRLGISAANMNLGWTSLLNLKIASALSISVPLSLVYSDNFNISGVLSNTANNGVISGANVKLKVGDTIVDTTTTNTNGEYSFTRTPVHRGTHSFQVIFDGDNTFEASASTVVTREISKETSVLTASPSSQYVSIGDSITVNGSLTDDDGGILAGETISLLIDDIVEDTTTTDSNGEYSFTFTYPDNSTHTFKIVYGGDSNYTASECNVNIVLRTASSITVANTDDIVSLHGSVNSTTLTATVYDQNLNGLGGLSVAWYVDDVLADTTVTDSNGEATYTYESVNAGDVSVRAVCMSLSETYTITDTFFDNSYFYDIHNWNNYGTGNTVSINNNNVVFTSVTRRFTDEFININEYTLEFDFVATKNNRHILLYGQTPNINASDGYGVGRDIKNLIVEEYHDATTGTISLSNNLPASLVDANTHHVKIIRENNTAWFYIDDTLIYEFDMTNLSNTIGFTVWGGGVESLTNFNLHD